MMKKLAQTQKKSYKHELPLAMYQYIVAEKERSAILLTFGGNVSELLALCGSVLLSFRKQFSPATTLFSVIDCYYSHSLIFVSLVGFFVMLHLNKTLQTKATATNENIFLSSLNALFWNSFISNKLRNKGAVLSYRIFMKIKWTDNRMNHFQFPTSFILVGWW